MTKLIVILGICLLILYWPWKDKTQLDKATKVRRKMTKRMPRQLRVLVEIVDAIEADPLVNHGQDIKVGENGKFIQGQARLTNRCLQIQYIPAESGGVEMALCHFKRRAAAIIQHSGIIAVIQFRRSEHVKLSAELLYRTCEHRATPEKGTFEHQQARMILDFALMASEKVPVTA